MPDRVSLRWRLRLTSALGGLLFAAAMVATGLWLTPLPWPVVAAAGLAAGVFFAVMMARAMGPRLRQAQAAVAGYDRDTVRRASRALRRGQVPADARERAAATDIAHSRLRLLDGPTGKPHRVFAGCIPLYVLAAVLWSPWWWLAALFFAVMLAGSVWQVRGLRRWLQSVEG